MPKDNSNQRIGSPELSIIKPTYLDRIMSWFSESIQAYHRINLDWRDQIRRMTYVFFAYQIDIETTVRIFQHS
jgi:hypothetical protein